MPHRSALVSFVATRPSSVVPPAQLGAGLRLPRPGMPTSGAATARLPRGIGPRASPNFDIDAFHWKKPDHRPSRTWSELSVTLSIVGSRGCSARNVGLRSAAIGCSAAASGTSRSTGRRSRAHGRRQRRRSARARSAAPPGSWSATGRRSPTARSTSPTHAARRAKLASIVVHRRRQLAQRRVQVGGAFLQCCRASRRRRGSASRSCLLARAELASSGSPRCVLGGASTARARPARRRSRPALADERRELLDRRAQRGAAILQPVAEVVEQLGEPRALGRRQRVEDLGRSSPTWRCAPRAAVVAAELAGPLAAGIDEVEVHVVERRLGPQLRAGVAVERGTRRAGSAQARAGCRRGRSS